MGFGTTIVNAIGFTIAVTIINFLCNGYNSEAINKPTQFF
jgi:hypothetical protein